MRSDADRFASDNLPPPDEWPDLLLDSPAHRYPEHLNCVAELLDRWVEAGEGARPCLRTAAEAWTYADLQDRVDRIAHVLLSHGLRPGGRVLLRAPNTPMMVAAYLAVIKAGGIAVATMPLLRGREIAYIVDKAQIGLALCDHRLLADMAAAQALSPGLGTVLPMGGDGPDDLLSLMRAAPGPLRAYPSRADDVCLIAFTSGTTGQPKGTMHFHRDMLAICDAYGAQVLRARGEDVFIGTAPLAFTFGLGAVVLFPLRIGASAILLEQAAPEPLLDAIRTLRPTVCFTAPTAYRAMLAAWLDHTPEEWGLREHNATGKTRGAALPMGFNRTPHYTRGLVLVGDAGGMVNPFNGEGIAYAMASARIAAGVVAEAFALPAEERERALQAYPAAVEAEES